MVALVVRAARSVMVVPVVSVATVVSVGPGVPVVTAVVVGCMPVTVVTAVLAVPGTSVAPGRLGRRGMLALAELWVPPVPRVISVSPGRTGPLG